MFVKQIRGDDGFSMRTITGSGFDFFKESFTESGKNHIARIKSNLSEYAGKLAEKEQQKVELTQAVTGLTKQLSNVNLEEKLKLSVESKLKLGKELLFTLNGQMDNLHTDIDHNEEQLEFFKNNAKRTKQLSKYGSWDAYFEGEV